MSSWSTKTIGESWDSGSRRMREPVIIMSGWLVCSAGEDACVAVSAEGDACASATSGGGSVDCAAAEDANMSAAIAAPARRAIWVCFINPPLNRDEDQPREQLILTAVRGVEIDGESPG